MEYYGPWLRLFEGASGHPHAQLQGYTGMTGEQAPNIKV